MIKQYLIICLSVFMLWPSYNAMAEPGRVKLDEFMEQVWQTNPVIKEVEARVLAATAGQKAASRWQYNPEVEYEIESIDGQDQTHIFGLSQTIDWSGKAKSSGTVAQFELDAVQAERDDIRQNVTVDVLMALAEYRTAQNILDLSLQRNELMKKFVALAENSLKAGDIDRGEYNLAQLAFSESLIGKADAEMAVSEALQSLETAVGSSIGTYPNLPMSLPDISNIPVSEKMILELPSIRIKRSRVEAAKANVTKARRDRLADPTVGFKGGQDGGADMIGFSISLPLNVFNTYASDVDVAKHSVVVDAKALQTELYSAKTRLQSRQQNYTISKNAWEIWSNSGAQALAEQIDTLDRKLKVGELSSTDYLVQVKQALDTEQASQALYGKTWRSWFAWLAASGRAEHWVRKLGE